ncbi:hypothetical protein V7D15_07065 [Thermoanaerobacter thermohydrosulfuricus]
MKLKNFSQNIGGFLILAMVLLFILLIILTFKFVNYQSSKLISDLGNKIDGAVEDLQNPKIISQHVNNVETKTFTLISTDGYCIGKGFIDGTLYYIFQIKEETNKKGYETAPVADSEFVYDGKNIVEVTRTSITQKYKSRVDNKVKTEEIDKYHYVFHVSNNNVKDYGVIQEKVEYYGYSSVSFFPIFIPFFLK